MNRSEFIKTIMGLYPHTFDINNETQYAGWIKQYQQIPESWDFDKLMRLFAKNWHSTREAPAPSWFMQYREDVKSVRQYEPEIVRMTPEEKARTDKFMKEFKSKLFDIAEKHKI